MLTNDPVNNPSAEGNPPARRKPGRPRKVQAVAAPKDGPPNTQTGGEGVTGMGPPADPDRSPAPTKNLRKKAPVNRSESSDVEGLARKPSNLEIWRAKQRALKADAEAKALQVENPSASKLAGDKFRSTLGSTQDSRVEALMAMVAGLAAKVEALTQPQVTVTQTTIPAVQAIAPVVTFANPDLPEPHPVNTKLWHEEGEPVESELVAGGDANPLAKLMRQLRYPLDKEGQVVAMLAAYMAPSVDYADPAGAMFPALRADVALAEMKDYVLTLRPELPKKQMAPTTKRLFPEAKAQ